MSWFTWRAISPMVARCSAVRSFLTPSRRRPVMSPSRRDRRPTSSFLEDEKSTSRLSRSRFPVRSASSRNGRLMRPDRKIASNTDTIIAKSNTAPIHRFTSLNNLFSGARSWVTRSQASSSLPSWMRGRCSDLTIVPSRLRPYSVSKTGRPSARRPARASVVAKDPWGQMTAKARSPSRFRLPRRFSSSRSPAVRWKVRPPRVMGRERASARKDSSGVRTATSPWPPRVWASRVCSFGSSSPYASRKWPLLTVRPLSSWISSMSRSMSDICRGAKSST